MTSACCRGNELSRISGDAGGTGTEFHRRELDGLDGLDGASHDRVCNSASTDATCFLLVTSLENKRWPLCVRAVHRSPAKCADLNNKRMNPARYLPLWVTVTRQEMVQCPPHPT